MTCKPSQRPREQLKRLSKEFRVTGLNREGRLQFFYHCPQSGLPIRDVIGRRKREPHIEKNAENYCVECYQNNIVGFLKSREKYLFLFTRCASKDPALRNYHGDRLVVGYITKERWLWRGNHYAVQGFTKIVPFEYAFPLAKLGSRSRYWRMKRLNTSQTSHILKRFAHATNIRSACIREIQRLEKTIYSVTQ